MAALFDLDVERDRRADQAFEVVVDEVNSLTPADAIRRIQGYEGRLAGLKVAAAAKLNAATGSDKAAKAAMNDGKTSKRSRAKAAKRGDVANKNPSLIDKVDKGELSAEQLDVIADASAKSDGAAAVDEAFIDKIGSVDPDQGETFKDDYLADRATAGGTQSEHERQRALRRAFRYVAKKTGLDVISIESDSVAATHMWAEITTRADVLYEADGGRDIPHNEHPRTAEQRFNDAAYELICNVTTTPTGVKRTPRFAAPKPAPSRPQIVVGLTLDQFLGLDREAVATQIGLGAIPNSVLMDYLEHADIVGALYDKNGQPLWLARSRRHASLTQRLALILRDKHCVLCGADHPKCDAHHTMPWTAPAQGETNLDNLVLLCKTCHTTLHHDNHTIYTDPNRIWRTRPALPHETPPARPEHTYKPTKTVRDSRNNPQRE